MFELNDKIMSELRRKDYYQQALESLDAITGGGLEPDFCIWLAGRQPPLEERSDRAIAAALWYYLEDNDA